MDRTPAPLAVLILPGLAGFGDWFGGDSEREELDERREALVERAAAVGNGDLPPALAVRLEAVDESREATDAYRGALDGLERVVRNFEAIDARHAEIEERVERAHRRVREADPPFAVPFGRFDRVLQRTDPSALDLDDVADAERAFQNLERILDVVEGFDYGALERLFPVEEGALDGAEPDRLYRAIESPDDLSALAERLSELAALVETLAGTALDGRSRWLADADVATDDIAERLEAAIQEGDADACRQLLEQVDHAERLAHQIASLREEVDELGWPTLEVDVSAILDDLDTMGDDETLGLTRQRLEFYENAVSAVRDLNTVESAPYDVETDAVREALQEGFEDADREAVADAAKRASDLAELVEKGGDVERMLRDHGAAADGEGGDGERVAPDARGVSPEQVAEIREALDAAIAARDLPALTRLEERLRRLEEARWTRRDFFKFTPAGVVDVVADLWRGRGYDVEPEDEGSLVATDDGERVLVHVERRESGDATVSVDAVQRAARRARRNDAERAVLVTNAGFTRRVLANSEKATPPVELVDGEELAEELAEADVTPPL